MQVQRMMAMPPAPLLLRCGVLPHTSPPATGTVGETQRAVGRTTSADGVSTTKAVKNEEVSQLPCLGKGYYSGVRSEKGKRQQEERTQPLHHQGSRVEEHAYCCWDCHHIRRRHHCCLLLLCCPHRRRRCCCPSGGGPRSLRPGSTPAAPAERPCLPSPPPSPPHTLCALRSLTARRVSQATGPRCPPPSPPAPPPRTRRHRFLGCRTRIRRRRRCGWKCCPSRR
mmetsp:Transcript_41395/g.81328  ORF Transcript_41395/g.81328 Transcript_41395/m.81328 type:complete len:225 (+) Transcript_41395:208-882(+)